MNNSNEFQQLIINATVETMISVLGFEKAIDVIRDWLVEHQTDKEFEGYDFYQKYNEQLKDIKAERLIN